MRKEVINFLISRDGKENCGLTWKEIAEKHGLEPSDKNAKKLSDWWRYYEETGNRTPDDEAEWMCTSKWQVQGKNGVLKWLRSYKRDLTPDHYKKVFSEYEKRITEKIKKITPRRKTVVPESDKALMVYTADKHVGAFTEPTSPFDNEYNGHIFEQRMMRVVDEIVRKVKLHGRFKKLYFVDLGDSADGYDNKTARGLELEQNMTDRQILDVYSEVHMKIADSLYEAEVAEDIEFIFLSNDNHAGPYSYAVQKPVEVYINTKYPDWKTRMFIRFIDEVYYRNHAFLMTHGKDEKYMRSGFPKKIDRKTENYILNYIRERGVNKPYIHLIKGDLHQNSEDEVSGFRYRNIPSIYGSYGHAQVNYGPNEAGFTLEVVKEHSIITEPIWFRE